MIGIGLTKPNSILIALMIAMVVLISIFGMLNRRIADNREKSNIEQKIDSLSNQIIYLQKLIEDEKQF